jgi:hypothetical protein
VDTTNLRAALDLAGRCTGLAERGEQDADEQGDDRDHDQQLDQRKAFFEFFMTVS